MATYSNTCLTGVKKCQLSTQPQRGTICASALHWWLCQEGLDDDHCSPLPHWYPKWRTLAFSIQPVPLWVQFCPLCSLSLTLLGLGRDHAVHRHGLNLNSPFISHCNNLLVPLTFSVNRELGRYQWLVRMKGNTSHQLWKQQHLLYFSCYLWPGTYNWPHSWDRNHMHKETQFNPLLAHYSWVLTTCANVRAINTPLSGSAT